MSSKNARGDKSETSESSGLRSRPAKGSGSAAKEVAHKETDEWEAFDAQQVTSHSSDKDLYVLT